MQDLSAQITDLAGFTYNVKKLYQCGNVMTLDIIATNNTGSTIAAQAPLFTLPSFAIPTTRYFTCLVGLSGVGYALFQQSTSQVKCGSAMENGKMIEIQLTYTIA